MTTAKPKMLFFSLFFKGRVPFSTRLLVYLAAWLLAALAFQVLVPFAPGPQPADTLLHQRIETFFLTPILIFLGLLAALNSIYNETVFTPLVMFFLVHVSLSLICARRGFFAFLIAVQVLVLAIGISSYFRLAPNAPY